MKKLVKRHAPASLQSWLRRTYYRFPVLRRLYYLPRDAGEWLARARGGNDRLRPPRSMIFVGDGDFDGVGREYLGYFTGIAGLAPHERVLELGSGIGRMALPLTGYLDRSGSYEGLDIVAAGIRWCQKRITPLFPNFHFQMADVFNRQYNPKGRSPASAYRFPFVDNHFDFVFLTSVFTHMLPAEVENYLAEIARVLKPGGRCLATFFLLNREALSLLDSKPTRFRHPFQDCLVIDPQLPEASIAHDEKRIRQNHQRCRLTIAEPIRYGSWCGRDRHLSYQDIVLARKPAGRSQPIDRP